MMIKDNFYMFITLFLDIQETDFRLRTLKFIFFILYRRGHKFQFTAKYLFLT